MNRHQVTLFLAVLAGMAAGVPVQAQTDGTPVGTAFNYQGRIKLNGSLITGRTDFRFTLFDALSGGTQVGSPVTILPDQMNLTANNVVNGLFSAVLNAGGEFGPSAFDGNARWLQLEVRHPSNPAMGNSGFSPVTPRQALNPAPYAISGAGWVGSPTGPIYHMGNVGIGTPSPQYSLDVRLGLPSDRARIVHPTAPLWLELDAQSQSAIDFKIAGQLKWQQAVSSDGDISWYDSTGLYRLVMAQGGNVGVGTNSPTADVHVYSDGVTKLRVESVGTNAICELAAPLQPELHFLQGSATPSWKILSQQGSNKLGFYDASGLPKLSISQGGNVGIGTGSPAAALHIDGTGPNIKVQGSTNGAGLVLTADNGDSQIQLERPGFLWQILGLSTNEFQIRNNGGTRLAILQNGNVGIGTSTPSQALHVIGCVVSSNIGSCSDNRYKQDISGLVDALSQIERLRGVSFNWRCEEFPDQKFDKGPQIGFIAQDVREVVPQVVLEGSDGYLSIDYGRLTPVLVEAVKELHGIVNEKDAAISQHEQRIVSQQQQITQQQSDLAAQRVEISNLTSRVDELEAMVRQLAPHTRPQQEGGQR